MNSTPHPAPLLLAFRPEGKTCLTARVTADALGFRPEQVWNPSPSAEHRTAPWPLPKTLRIGIFGNADTNARFSPPPAAIVALGGGRRTALAVGAEPGWHLWNEVEFTADSGELRVRIDLEGHSRPEAVAPHLRLALTPGEPDEPLLDLLARSLRPLYPAAYRRPRRPAPAWWKHPSYCGWGDQVACSLWLEGVGPEPRAIAYNTQGLYERWIRRLDRAGLPFGTITIDCGWAPAGTLRPNPERWPDLKGFVRRQHEAGRKVLLWLAAWLWEGLPDSWCVFADGVKLVADPTHPGYRRFLRERVRELISPDGLDADGFKIDQLAYSPSERKPRGGPQFGRTRYYRPPHTPIRLAGPGWGCELLYRLQRDIYEAAKSVKPDCLITSSTVHPYFHDTLDMVRLHDMGAVAPDIFAAMGARAGLARAALPHKLVDADDWIHTDYRLWRRYTAGSGVLGVPSIFYAERFVADWQAEPATRPVPLSDLRAIAAAWRRPERL